MNNNTDEFDTQTAQTAKVLIFTIDEQTYCLELEYVTEIIDGGEMTSLPNTPDHVEGVMDLRGQTTTIINPLTMLESGGMGTADLLTDGGEVTKRIIMLNSELVDGDGALGWLVSTVSEVTDIPISRIDGGEITDTDLIRGVVKQKDSDEFVIWLTPEGLTA